MIVELFDSYGYDSKGGNFICNAVRKGLKYEPETRVPRKRNALYTFLIESGQETNDINQSPLLYKNKIECDEPIPKHDYSKDYFTFEAIQDTTFTFTQNALQYSLDNGATWTTLAANTASPTIASGSKIMWKQTGLTPVDHYGIGTFSATGNFNVVGNIMSLYYGDNFVGQGNLTGKSYAFESLFYDNTKLIDASNLILPATTLADNCYAKMFWGCTSLTKFPKLPATTLSYSCYYGMATSCKSLITAPELPATTLAQGCYYFMFYDCSSLIIPPKLPATALAKNCYEEMFGVCTSLTTTPELPATTMEDYCYSGMFNGCTSLAETTPKLPATTLAQCCYSAMFSNCTALTRMPEICATTLAKSCCEEMFNECTSLVTTQRILPATTLAHSCYAFMFSGCTSLTTAPELPATTLAGYCYSAMFDGCTSLNYIKCLATDISANNCTNYWVSSVSASGTFVKASSMSSWTTGNNGIPTGWSIENA